MSVIFSPACQRCAHAFLRTAPIYLSFWRESMTILGRGRLLTAIRMSAILFSCAPIFAQVDTGTILGTVRDPTGGVIPNAAITLTNENQQTSQKAATNADGNY